MVEGRLVGPSNKLPFPKGVENNPHAQGPAQYSAETNPLYQLKLYFAYFKRTRETNWKTWLFKRFYR